MSIIGRLTTLCRRYWRRRRSGVVERSRGESELRSSASSSGLFETNQGRIIPRSYDTKVNAGFNAAWNPGDLCEEDELLGIISSGGVGVAIAVSEGLLCRIFEDDFGMRVLIALMSPRDLC